MVIPIFCNCWYISIPIIPLIIYLLILLGLSIASLISFKSKNVIKPIRIIDPTKPKLLEYTANIKSVWGSGKYNGVLLNPWPNIPADPIAISELFNWSPLLLDQLVNLSIL